MFSDSMDIELTTQSPSVKHLYVVGIKTQKFICRNLKLDYQILIIFGRNIPDTVGHQMIIYVPISPNVCFCTTWESKISKMLHFYAMQYHYLI